MPTWLRIEKRLGEINDEIDRPLILDKVPDLLKELKLLETDVYKCVTIKVEWPAILERRSMATLFNVIKVTQELLENTPSISSPSKKDLYSLTLVTLRTLGQLFTLPRCSSPEECIPMLLTFIDRIIFKKILYSSDLVIIAVHLWVTAQRKFLDKSHSDIIDIIEENHFPESIKLACMNSLVTEFSDPTLLSFIYQIDSAFFLNSPQQISHHSEPEVNVIKAKYCLQLCQSLVKLAGKLPNEVEDRLFFYAYSYVSDRLESSIDIIRILSFDSLRYLLRYDLSLKGGELSKQLLANADTYLNDYQGSLFHAICIVVEVIGVEKSLEFCDKLVDFCVKFLEDRNDVPSYLIDLVTRLSAYNLVDFFNKLTLLSSKASLRVMDQIIPKLSKKDPLLIKRLVDLGLLSDLKVDLRFKLKLLHLYNSSHSGDALQTQDLLRESIFHFDESTRLQALGVIIESRKLSTPLPQDNLTLILESLNVGLTIQEPCNRQRFLVLMDKLFERLKCSLEYSLREGKDQEIYPSYQTFASSVLEICFDSLYIDGYFARRTLALELIIMVLTNLDNVGPFRAQNLFSSLPSKDSVYRTLMNCLVEDSLEETKQLCIDLLLQLIKCKVIILSDKDINEIRTKAFKTLSSINPLDVLTASFMFRCLTRISSQDGSIRSIDVHLDILDLLTNQVEQAIKQTQESILDGAVYNPIHSKLTSIHGLIDSLESSCFNHRKSDWKILLSKIQTVCLEASKVVGSIVCNDSPEGFLPMDLQPLNNEMVARIMGRDCSSTSSNIQIEKRRDITSQMLLIFGWKTIKEAALILGKLCEKIDHGLIDNPDCVLSCSNIQRILNYFVHHLKELKHRGAFEQAYIGFSMMVKSLWRKNCQCLQVVANLLEEIIQDLADVNPGQGKKCITRRSAGLPFVTQAIVSSEPKENRNKLLDYTVRNLINICQKVNSQDWQKVHCMNVLRALMRDQRLGDRVDPYLEDCLKLCINHFSYPSYSVSNSASILFSALVVRIFGVNRSRDYNHKKNAMSAKHFFLRFPSIDSFILTNLNSNHSGRHLLPIILIILRLWPSIREADGQLLAFIEPLKTLCFLSTVRKVRELSAQALAQIMGSDESLIRETLSQICLDLSRPDLTSNHRDGTILLLFHCLRSHVKQINTKSPNFLVAGIVGQTEKLLHSATLQDQRPSSYYMFSHFISAIEILLKEQIIIAEDQIVSDLHKTLLVLLARYKSNPRSIHLSCAQDFMVKLIYFSLNHAPYDIMIQVSKFLLDPSLPMEMVHLRTVVFKFLAETLAREDRSLENSVGQEILTDYELNIPERENLNPMDDPIKPVKVMELLSSCPEYQSLLDVNNFTGFQLQRNLQQFLFLLYTTIDQLGTNSLDSSREYFDQCLGLFSRLDSTSINEDTLALFYLVISCIWNHRIASEDGLINSTDFEKFCSEAIQICSIDRSDLSRKAAVIIVSTLLPAMVKAISSKNGNSKEKYFTALAHLWRALPNLLQDNEPEIRKSTAILLHNLIHKSYYIPSEARQGPLLNCAFQLLFRIFVDNSKENHLRSLLFDIILNQQSISEYDDEDGRFFDKSKINFFEDPIQMLAITRTFLDKLTPCFKCDFFHRALLGHVGKLPDDLFALYQNLMVKISTIEKSFLQKLSDVNLSLDIYKILMILQLWIKSNCLCEACDAAKDEMKKAVMSFSQESELEFGIAKEMQSLKKLLSSDKEN